MVPHAAAASAYAKTTRSVGTPRSIEYHAFQRVTAQLAAAAQPQAAFSTVAEAVHMNTRLWTLLAVDVASSRNQLPAELRGQILGLAQFARRTGDKVLAQTAEISELIDVNQLIMKGLRGDASAKSGGDADAKAG